MSVEALLNALPAIITKLIDGIKVLVTGWFIRRATKIEAKKDALEQENTTKDQQLEIAARPSPPPSDVRDSLFRD